LIFTPLLFSASATACLMLATVLSMFATTPLDTPADSALPVPRISTFPNSFLRPTIAAILEVPMSSPTMISFSITFSATKYQFMIVYYLFFYIQPDFYTSGLSFHIVPILLMAIRVYTYYQVSPAFGSDW